MKRTLIWMGIGYMVVITCFFAWNDFQSDGTNQQPLSETVVTFEG